MAWPHLAPYFSGERWAPLELGAGTEFLAVLLFQLLAGSTSSPLGVAFTFSAIMFAFSFIHGSHISPSVTLGASLGGYISWIRLGSFLVAQFLGALVGAVLQVWLVPGFSFGEDADTTCHSPAKGISDTPLFVWETLGALVFALALHSAIFRAPGHGPVAPLTAGVTLYALLSTVGQFNGGSPFNPAVTLASAIVFKCWRSAWVYLLGQLTGGALAAALVVALQGRGPFFTGDRREGELQRAEEGRAAGAGGGVAEPEGVSLYQPLSRE